MKLIPIIDTEEQCLGVRLGGLKGDHEAIGEFVEFLKDKLYPQVVQWQEGMILARYVIGV